jgi:hypothetical protein
MRKKLGGSQEKNSITADLVSEVQGLLVDKEFLEGKCHGLLQKKRVVSRK